MRYKCSLLQVLEHRGEPQKDRKERDGNEGWEGGRMKRKIKGAKVEKKLALNGDGKGKQGKRPLNAVSLSY